MEWIHLVLALAVYCKIIVLIYYVLRYLSWMQKGPQNKPKGVKRDLGD